MRPRPLDNFTPSQDTALWLVLAAAICLILGIVVRALRAEWKREREQAANPRMDAKPEIVPDPGTREGHSGK